MSRKNVIIVTFALLLSNAMSGLDGTCVNTALPAIIADLHGLELMGWVVAVFLLGTAVSTPLWSKLGERVGNRRAYEMAAIMFVVGSFLQGCSVNMIMLIFARGLAGVGSGGMVSLPYIIYAQLYKNPRKRMQVLGLVTASYSTATIIGPLVGGAIVDAWSWHWVFYLNVPIGLLSAILVQVFFKEKVKAKARAKFDYLGTCFLSVGLISLLMTIEMIGRKSMLMILLLALLALLCFIGLIWAERHAADPIIPGRLFQNVDLLVDFGLFTIIWGAFMAFVTYGPMWAQALLGLSALIGGCTQIPSSLTNFAAASIAAPLRRRISAQQLLLIGICMLLGTYIIMTLAGVHAAYWVILAAGAFEGFGNGVIFSELQVKVQTDAETRDVPVATSFSFLIRMLAQSVTAALFGLVMNRALHAGVTKAGGKITMGMMNKLSNAQSNKSLPQHLLPEMRGILYTGLHHIMLVALVFMLVALALNLWALRRELHAKRVAA